MAKLKKNPITVDDIREFVEDHSDFTFELSVYSQLIELGFTCDHGGTYSDPLTKKIRQFDIRATWTDHSQWLLPQEQIRLAVECKQLQDNFPLVIHTVPRKFDEGTHDVLLSVDPEKFDLSHEVQITIPAFVPNAMKWEVAGKFSIYNENKPVGKSCAQVGRDQAGITSTNSDVFNKWTQAISSAQVLADRASDEGSGYKYHGALVTIILPVVVVPNNRLWEVQFNADGMQQTEPRMVNRCPYWIDSMAECGDRLTGFSYTITQLEFVTTDGLTKLTQDLMDEMNRESYFGRRHFKRRLGLEKGVDTVYP